MQASSVVRDDIPHILEMTEYDPTPCDSSPSHRKRRLNLRVL